MVEPGGAVAGIQLTRTEENVAEIDALARLLGGRVGLPGVLADLDRRARPSRLGRLLGRAVDEAYAWDRHDSRDRRWYPQGISGTADAEDEVDTVEGRRLLVTTWYARGEGKRAVGSRVSFLDLETLRYRHVLLVEPTLDADGTLALEPLRVHAGGVVWRGPYLHVAATSAGFVSFHVDDVLRVDGADQAPDLVGLHDGRVASWGHRFVLPVRFRYRAHKAGGGGLRYSFLSLERSTEPPGLLAGEYARRGGSPTRLARFDLSADRWLLHQGEDGRSRPATLDDGGVVRMQGAVVARGRHHVTASRSGWWPGSVYVGRPGSLRQRRLAVPMGPEDLAWWPSTDRLWTLTEHPRRRWLVSLRRDWFD